MTGINLAENSKSTNFRLTEKKKSSLSRMNRRSHKPFSENLSQINSDTISNKKDGNYLEFIENLGKMKDKFLQKCYDYKDEPEAIEISNNDFDPINDTPKWLNGHEIARNNLRRKEGHFCNYENKTEVMDQDLLFIVSLNLPHYSFSEGRNPMEDCVLLKPEVDIWCFSEMYVKEKVVGVFVSVLRMYSLTYSIYRNNYFPICRYFLSLF